MKDYDPCEIINFPSEIIIKNNNFEKLMIKIEHKSFKRIDIIQQTFIHPKWCYSAWIDVGFIRSLIFSICDTFQLIPHIYFWESKRLINSIESYDKLIEHALRNLDFYEDFFDFCCPKYVYFYRSNDFGANDFIAKAFIDPYYEGPEPYCDTVLFVFLFNSDFIGEDIFTKEIFKKLGEKFSISIDPAAQNLKMKQKISEKFQYFYRRLFP